MKNNPCAKKNLLIVCTTLTRGGAERDTANIANHLDRAYYKVDIALMRMVVDYPIADDVTIHDLGKHHLIDNIKAIWRLRELIKNNNYEIILSSLSTTNFLTLLAAFTLRKFPLWIAYIDINPTQLGLTEPNVIKATIKKSLQSLVFHRANALLTNSFGSRDGILQITSESSKKIRVIYNPVDLKLISRLSLQPPKFVNPGHESIVLISVVRLEPEKDVAMALRAISTLINSGLDLHYVICGSGSQSDSLKQLAAELGISNQVIFTGFIQNPYAEMTNAYIFILTSKVEGLPNSLTQGDRDSGARYPCCRYQLPQWTIRVDRTRSHWSFSPSRRPGDIDCCYQNASN